MTGILNFEFGTEWKKPSLQAIIYHDNNHDNHDNNNNKKNNDDVTYVSDQTLIFQSSSSSSNQHCHTPTSTSANTGESSYGDDIIVPPLELIQDALLRANRSLVKNLKSYNHKSNHDHDGHSDDDDDDAKMLIFDKSVNQLCHASNMDMYMMNMLGKQYVICVGASPMVPLQQQQQQQQAAVPHFIISDEMIIRLKVFSHQRTIDWLRESVSRKKREICAEDTSLSKTMKTSKNMRTLPHLGDKKNQDSSSLLLNRRSQIEKMNVMIENDEPWFTNFEKCCRFDWIRDEQTCQQMMTMKRRRSIDGEEPVKKQKICIFLHGVGNSDDISGPPTNEFSYYWGSVNQYTPQCSERWFIREETKKRGWDDIELQNAYCKLALINQTDPSDRIIRDKVLFVHSMGNLVLSGAIQRGLCNIDPETTSWYEVQAPFAGSKAAGELETICLYIHNGEWISHFTPRFVKWVATTGGYCVPGTNHSYPAYHTLSPSRKDWPELRKIATEKIKGALCGNSAYGLNSMYSAALFTLSQYVGYGDDNDGMVAWSSCHVGDRDFSINYEDPFYIATINHADGTCRNGNGYWGSYRQPCSWFTDKL